MLERILSLIPRKPDGKFEHGELKIFASKIGLKSGNVVSDWMAGRSKSYKKYLFQIASIYKVSVAWLKGETDDPAPGQKNKPTVISDDGLDDTQGELIRLIKELTPYEISVLLKNAQSLIECRQSPDAQ